MNVQDAAIQILKDAGKPLHAIEIFEQAENFKKYQGAK